MKKNNQLLVSALLAVASMTYPGESSAQGLSNKQFGSVRQENLHWAPFAAFPAGAQMAIVVGDTKLPEPYVVRVKVPSGIKLMPHKHPEDRVYTVVSGTFYIGIGEKFNSAELKAYGPGSVIVLPANTPHFHWAMSGEYVTQVAGRGPLGISYINPLDDPRNQKKQNEKPAMKKIKA